MANYISKYTGAQIDKAVGDVLNGNVSGTGGGGNITIDDTLTKAGAAADAKATGDRLTALSDENGVPIVGEHYTNYFARGTGSISVHSEITVKTIEKR